MSDIRSNRITPVARVLLALCISGAAALGFAQEPAALPPQAHDHVPHEGGPGEGAERQQRQLDHLTKALELTPDQVTQVKAIQLDGHQQMMALRQNTAISQADRHSQMMALHQAEQSRVEAVLTSEQKTKFETMRLRMGEHRGQHHGADQAPPPPPVV